MAIKSIEEDHPAVRVINEDPDSFFGLTFPLGHTNRGFFPRAATLREQAFSNLKNLLLTRKGERLAQPTFGSRLHEIIFEQSDADIGDKIEASIREAVEEWLDYIIVQNVFVTRENNSVFITLEFSVTLDDPDSIDQLTFTFSGV